MNTDDKIAELKEATRVANETLTDIKQVLKEVKRQRGEVEAMIEQAFEDKVSSRVEEYLKEYSASLDDAIEKGTQAVFDRFDTITKMLLGETREHQRKGEKTVPEMIREKAVRDRALYLQSVGPDEYPTGYYMHLAEEQLKEEGRIE